MRSSALWGLPGWFVIPVVLNLCCSNQHTASISGDGGTGGAAGPVADAGGGTGGNTGAPSSGRASPGSAITDVTAFGPGACANQRLEDVIAVVHEGWPAVKDIQRIYSDQQLGDGSFIYAFVAADGFDLAFKRGGGDCPAGCTENEYWYFATDSACAPSQVGHYSAAWATGNCLMTVGQPMWGLPNPPDPVNVCGSDNRPADLNGVYKFRGMGKKIACTALAGAEPQVSVDLPLTITVAQLPSDLTKGTVVIQGSGYDHVDGKAIDATFTRRRFSATVPQTNLSSTCMDSYSVDVQYDFESGAAGRLHVFEVKTIDCQTSQAYCKGDLEVALTPAAP